MFLNAEPQKVGKNARSRVPLRIHALICSTVGSSPSM
ncbi:Uncharacterised protein [Vibrio cholerae]|nr:Uncharacterised protein [Vibrio cholerae]